MSRFILCKNKRNCKFHLKYKINFIKLKKMKKILLLILFNVFVSINIFTYENPYWNIQNKLIYRINDFIPDSVNLNFSNTYDKTRGWSLNFLYEHTVKINFSNSVFFYNKLNLVDNIPKLKSFDFGSFYRPFKFAAIDVDYKFRNFMQYKIAEHDLVIKLVFIFDYIKYLNINIETGFAFRFVDVNIFDNKTVYKKDWLFNASFKWKILCLFHPFFFYSFGIALGNIPEYDLYTFNYWQLEIFAYFHLPKNFSIFLNSGFGYAGSLPFAGIISKVWFRIGASYEIKNL